MAPTTRPPEQLVPVERPAETDTREQDHSSDLIVVSGPVEEFWLEQPSWSGRTGKDVLFVDQTTRRQVLDAPSYPVSVLFQIVDNLQDQIDQVVSYVNPRLASQDEFAGRSERVTAKLDELRTALSRGDDVELYAIRSSLRLDLRALRDTKDLHTNHRYAIGYVFDALTYTPFRRIGVPQIDALADSLSVALGSSVPGLDELDSVRSRLEAADFELFPPVAE